MNFNATKRYKEIDFPFTCPITNRIFNSGKGLSIYLTKTLKIDHSIYYNTYVNHRDSKCFFCRDKGEFISVSKGYRNLCSNEECVKKSFSSHSIEGLMYRNMCSRKEAEKIFEKENQRQLEERLKTQEVLRKEDPLWDKKRSRNCKEFWVEKGYSEDQAILKAQEVMNEIHEKTFKKFKENPNKYASKHTTKIEYYLKKGYSEEDAKKLLSERQTTFSLDICIEKYGEEKGKKIWLDRQLKWQRKLSDNGNIKGGFSKISQKLFFSILEKYNDIEKKDVFFYTKNNEVILKNESNLYLYDFTDIKKKKIIEYNGDQYHANPEIYKKDDFPHPYHKTHNYTSEKIWERDKIKYELAILNNYDVLVIWDSEYRKNPEQTLEKCLNFLNN
jgi:hypothetical protein